MAKSDRASKTKKKFGTKKCPDCFEVLVLEAKKCTYCEKQVGPVDKNGYAKRPVDWKGYAYLISSWSLFGFYIWWAFIR